MEITTFLVVSIVFLLINYSISKYDFINPAVIFCLMNMLSAIMAVLMKYIYGIEFHWNTVGVLITGLFVFTMANFFSWGVSKKGIVIGKIKKKEFKEKNAYVNILWIILIIVFELIVAYFRIKYVRSVVKTINGGALGLAEVIGRYNSIVKNRPELLRSAGIRASKIYTYGWPICISFNIVLSSLAVYRKKVKGRFPLSYLIPYILMIIISFLSGGRTAALRYIVAFIILYIFITRYLQKSYRKGNSKMIRILVPSMIIILIGLGLSINLIGRTTKIPLFEYTTAYLGAPLYNLDIYYNSHHNLTTLFGEQTFQSVYSFIGTHFHLPQFIYDLNLPYNTYQGHYLGNVYTMYFAFLQDFGYLGVIPLTAFVAGYFTISYRRLMNFKRSNIGISLFTYAYLFNDLVFAMFSCKFYESIFSTIFIIYFLGTIIIWSAVNKGLLSKGLSFRKRDKRIRYCNYL